MLRQGAVGRFRKRQKADFRNRTEQTINYVLKADLGKFVGRVKSRNSIATRSPRVSGRLGTDRLTKSMTTNQSYAIPRGNLLISSFVTVFFSTRGNNDSISSRVRCSTSTRNRHNASDTISLTLSRSSCLSCRRASITDKTSRSAGVSDIVIGRAFVGRRFFRDIFGKFPLSRSISHYNVFMRIEHGELPTNMCQTNDIQIRQVLRTFVKEEQRDSPGIVFVEEFALYGGTIRADLACLNGHSHGYEIKSDRDNLVRLPGQVNAYNDVFERATLVVAPRHLGACRSFIPAWWGIVRAIARPDSEVHLERVRQSRPNPSLDGLAVAALLWRPEALHLLSSLGLDTGIRSKPMQSLMECLAREVDPVQLSCYVRQAIRARGDWRAAARLRQYDDTLQLPSSRWGSRRNPYANKSQ